MDTSGQCLPRRTRHWQCAVRSLGDPTQAHMDPREPFSRVGVPVLRSACCHRMCHPMALRLVVIHAPS
jgi:hypothetical protein